MSTMAKEETEPASATVFVRGFDFGTTEAQLESHMSQAGTIEQVKWCTKGSARITFHSKDEAAMAVSTLNGSIIDGNSRFIDVIPKEEDDEPPAKRFKSAGGTGIMPGDWNCPSCGDLQFAKNMSCRMCGMPRPGGGAIAGGNGAGAKPGDWNCPSCGDLQFAKNTACRMCGTPRHGGGNPGGVKLEASNGEGAKPGDWNCPSCGDLQFARNTACRMCGTPRIGGGKPGGGKAGGCKAGGGTPVGGTPVGGKPGGGKLGGGKFGGGKLEASNGEGAKPGDWSCVACGDLQFAKNTACRMCGAPRPAMPLGKGTGGGTGDWYCPSCGDLQFAKNFQCRMCGTPRPGGGGAAAGSLQAMFSAMMSAMFNGGGKGFGKFAGGVPAPSAVVRTSAADNKDADPAGSGRVYVRGFDFGTTDEQLASHMQAAGPIHQIHKIDKGSAIVVYKKGVSADRAANTLNSTVLLGNTRYIDVILK